MQIDDRDNSSKPKSGVALAPDTQERIISLDVLPGVTGFRHLLDEYPIIFSAILGLH